MSIWNKVLIGLIVVTSAVFFYMAARTLKTHQYWRELAEAHQEKIDAIAKENIELVRGEESEEEQRLMGIDELRVELHKMLIDRGRVWYECQPDQVDPRTGKAAVTVGLPDPHQIRDKSVLYVFEEADVQQGGRYLGAFKVTGVADKQIQIEPLMKPQPRELEKLAGSLGPWLLYEKMPTDNRELFAALNEAELQALLPESSVQEYIKDGQEAAPDDPPERVETDEDGQKTYVRRLRDYDALLKWHHMQRVLLADQQETVRRDHQFAADARTDAEKQLQFRESEAQTLRQKREAVARQRDVVASLARQLQVRAAAYQSAVVKVLSTNKAVAGQIAKIQLDASRRINARTREMAQAAGTSN